jgi:transmembrane sensor
MDLQNMYFKYLVKKLISETDSTDKQDFENRLSKDPLLSNEYLFLQEIWKEAGNAQIFKYINTNSDWEHVRARISHTATTRYRRISWQGYFLRIAAMILFVTGLSFGFYRIISSLHKTGKGFVTITAGKSFKDIILPDGSVVALKAGSELVYGDDFGASSRDIVLNGEALFSVIPDPSLPFKVFVNESVVEVTGTKFSIRVEDGSVKVSVISGTVLLSSKAAIDRKISITANQSGYWDTRKNKLGIEEGIPINNLSWKTGHLVFEETPIDSALMDIARHFRKDLSLETPITEEITAEFQDQPLREILEELQLVAGLEFDTTGTALIVRR